MTYCPVNCCSNFSFLNSFTQPGNLSNHLSNIGVGSCVISDNATLGGSLQFAEAFKKKGLKAIMSSKLNVGDGSVILIAKNKKGWGQIAKLVSVHNFKDAKVIPIGNIIDAYTGDFILTSGYMGSTLSNAILSERPRYSQKPTVENDHAKSVNALLSEYSSLKDDFYVEIQNNDDYILGVKIAANILRKICKIRKIKCVASAPSNYPRKSDAVDHRTLLYTELATVSDNAIPRAISSHRLDLIPYLKTNNYFVRDFDEISKINSESEIDMTMEIDSKCEYYDLKGSPIYPNFPCPGGMSTHEYLIKLCRGNWKEKTNYVDRSDYGMYGDRFKKELKVIEGAGLAPYFLIVQDYVNAAKDRGELVGAGRGSAAGSLISYLLKITTIDPIPYNLLFERFYNAGRNKGTYATPPDIDIDLCPERREDTIQYLRKKYGHDKVAQVMTYIKIKGRGALKEAMAGSGRLEFWQINKITKAIRDEAAISEELQQMKEEQGEANIIKWSLQNQPEDFSEWVTMDDDGKLSGPYASEFAQGIRLEGCRKSQGRHPAAVVLGDKPIDEIAPMVYDKKTEEPIIGMEYTDAEAMGMVKLDILGVSGLDKIMGVQKLLRGENFENE